MGERNGFVDRKEELAKLEESYEKGDSALFVLYGRRRVGKTSLLKELVERYDGLYLLGRQEAEKEQLERFSRELSRFFNDPVPEKDPFTNWDSFFTYLAEKMEKERFPLVFDEFPYIVQANESLPSILQDYWDNSFSKIDAYIAICGSSISMMEELLGYKSPIYGRRTEQMLLKPLNFFQTREFFPSRETEDIVEIYSILGGTPGYLLEFDREKSLEENIKEKMLRKQSFLHQDVPFVLREELREPRNYFSILHSISKGNTRIGGIINDTGLSKGTVSKYLSVLSDLHLVERNVPITEKNPEKSRNGLYSVQDNYFNFWFRFVFGNQNYIEQDRIDKLMEERIEPELNTYIGHKFEGIALQWLKKRYQDHLWGRWWHNEHEIDCVGVDESENSIIFGEVKWSELSKKDLKREAEKLREKAEKVKWGQEPRNERFIIIAREAPDLQIPEVNIHTLADIGT